MYPDKQEKLTRRKQIKRLPQVTSLLHRVQVSNYTPFFCYNCHKNGTAAQHHSSPETWTTHSHATLCLRLLIPPLHSRDVSHSLFWGESPGACSFQLLPLHLLRLLQEQACVRKSAQAATWGLWTLEKSFNRGVGCCWPKIMQKD